MFFFSKWFPKPKTFWASDLIMLFHGLREKEIREIPWALRRIDWEEFAISRLCQLQYYWNSDWENLLENISDKTNQKSCLRPLILHVILCSSLHIHITDFNYNNENVSCWNSHVSNERYPYQFNKKKIHFVVVCFLTYIILFHVNFDLKKKRKWKNLNRLGYELFANEWNTCVL